MWYCFNSGVLQCLLTTTICFVAVRYCTVLDRVTSFHTGVLVIYVIIMHDKLLKDVVQLNVRFV